MKEIPTYSLLYSSVSISFSGACRIVLAYLFIGSEISLLNISAGFLIIYATYTFDRIIGGEEDTINRSELRGARKDIALVICSIAFVSGAFLLYLDDLFLISLIPVIVGALYSKGVHIGKFHLKLKGGLGIKNFTVALTWGAFITGIILRDSGSVSTSASVFSFFFVKTFINTIVNDFRDIKGDKAAGLMTLPIYLGEKGTKMLLMVIHLIEHGLKAIIMICGILECELIIVISCLLSGIIYILIVCSPTNNLPKWNIMHKICYQFEFCLALGFRTLSNFFTVL